MLVRISLAALILATVTAEDETRLPRGRHKYPDPFSLLDRHMSVSFSHDHPLLPHLASPYFWPWAELAKAAVAIDEEDNIEEPSVHANSEIYEIKLDVHRFKPHEIKVKTKNRAVVVEGKRIVLDEKTDKRYVANHFVQRYTLPSGVEPEEVTAVIKSTGVLYISAPRHIALPSPKEREVPLLVEEDLVKEDVRSTENKTSEVEKPSKEIEDTIVQVKPNQPNESEDQPSDQKRMKQHLNRESSEETPSSKEELSTETVSSPEAEITGKIRKKELKNSNIDQKKNETKKTGDINELDYAVDANTE